MAHLTSVLNETQLSHKISIYFACLMCVIINNTHKKTEYLTVLWWSWKNSKSLHRIFNMKNIHRFVVLFTLLSLTLWTDVFFFFLHTLGGSFFPFPKYIYKKKNPKRMPNNTIFIIILMLLEISFFCVIKIYRNQFFCCCCVVSFCIVKSPPVTTLLVH